ncbi:hypothetical protein SFRURICE_005024, partial [Spodoptera frugiperda]
MFGRSVKYGGNNYRFDAVEFGALTGQLSRQHCHMKNLVQKYYEIFQPIQHFLSSHNYDLTNLSYKWSSLPVGPITRAPDPGIKPHYGARFMWLCFGTGWNLVIVSISLTSYNLYSDDLCVPGTVCKVNFATVNVIQGVKRCKQAMTQLICDRITDTTRRDACYVVETAYSRKCLTRNSTSFKPCKRLIFMSSIPRHTTRRLSRCYY